MLKKAIVTEGKITRTEEFIKGEKINIHFGGNILIISKIDMDETPLNVYLFEGNLYWRNISQADAYHGVEGFVVTQIKRKGDGNINSISYDKFLFGNRHSYVAYIE